MQQKRRPAWLTFLIVLAAIVLLNALAFWCTRFGPVAAFSPIQRRVFSLEAQDISSIMLKGVDGMAWVDLTPDGDSIWYNDDAPADYDVDFNKAVRLLNQLRYNLVLVDLGELLGMNGWTHVVAIGLKNGEYYNFECGEDWISVNGFVMCGGAEILRELFHIQ